ncbi:deoxynucleoside kinase [Reichenbachiella carrageenanivorans]|uniref:Deoxynucleoside kinase n=1 Tax=Reichenbachiella carrageenanivorans TaxID=2979869 RepID=A0ABY6D1F4_9BACT|nr:deoxynucleoside kinase [Reichenbachiella carrageenanivorans]UXX78903.1 deoxynucleoside kinase [Reichenbachiella carrageenanivorans]
MAIHPKHIAVSGNIGAGKTTLTEMLAKHYGWQAEFEDVDDNPYLSDFYSDMSQWAFHLQVYFLNSRFEQVNKVRAGEHTVIQDRTIYEDAYIFAKSLHHQGYFNDRDYNNYLSLFESMIQFVKAPDLLIYLKSDIDKLVRNIEKRGRTYESAIRIDYLQGLNTHYNDWISSYKEGRLLVIDVNPLDFVNNPDDFASIVSKIDVELHGLFS